MSFLKNMSMTSLTFFLKEISAIILKCLKPRVCSTTITGVYLKLNLIACIYLIIRVKFK